MARKATTKAKEKVASAKPAKKVANKKAACSCKAASANKLTRVLVKYNAGWGNQLFIRGTGAGLAVSFRFRDFETRDEIPDPFLAANLR